MNMFMEYAKILVCNILSYIITIKKVKYYIIILFLLIISSIISSIKDKYM